MEAPGTDRDGVKRDIIALFKRAMGPGPIGQIKDEISAWWSATSRGQRAPIRPAVHVTGRRSRDHIGASTYIEKGWSLISLGDYRERLDWTRS